MESLCQTDVAPLRLEPPFYREELLRPALGPVSNVPASSFADAKFAATLTDILRESVRYELGVRGYNI